MSERIKLGFWKRLKQEIIWLKEDIPPKFSEITGVAFIMICWVFYTQPIEAGERPGLTILGCVAGAWIGHEVIDRIAQAVKREKQQ